MLEANAINPKLDYSREEYCDELTFRKVYESLREAGVVHWMAEKAIEQIQKNGILFRERK